MITVISKLFRNLRLCNQMLVFSMHRNRVQRIYQRINQLDIFLARMSADMYIFENHICTLAHQFIDNTGNRFLISRNRMGTEYNGTFGLMVTLRCMPDAMRDNAAMDSPGFPL